MKSSLLAILFSLAAFGLSGCPLDDDDCGRDSSCVDGDFPYSCPEAGNCYQTKGACSASGEC